MKRLVLFCLILLLVYSCTPQYKIQSCVADIKDELPVYLGGGMTLVDIGIEGNDLIWVVEADEYPLGMALEMLNEPVINKTLKYSILDYTDLREQDDLRDLVEDMVESKYSLVIQFNCESLGISTELEFKPHELKYLCGEDN